jgi:ribosomal RNA assembly protein
LDLQLASGEYFLKPKDREAIQRKKQVEKVSSGYTHSSGRRRADPNSFRCLLQQQAVTEERRAQREEAFVAPAEKAAPTIHEKKEKKKKRKREEEGA